MAVPVTNGVKHENESDSQPNHDDQPLFSTDLVSPEVAAQLPEGYTIRPLRCSDYHKGYLEVLRVLTTVGEFSYEQWTERYEWMAKRNDEYYLLVICDETGKVVGTGSLIVERKFIHALGMVGHIEDIAIEKNQQGKKLGLRMINALDYVAAKVGCYKVFNLHVDILAMMITITDIEVRVFSIALKPTKVSISNAGLNALVSRWLITIMSDLYLDPQLAWLNTAD